MYKIDPLLSAEREQGSCNKTLGQCACESKHNQIESRQQKRKMGSLFTICVDTISPKFQSNITMWCGRVPPWLVCQLFFLFLFCWPRLGYELISNDTDNNKGTNGSVSNDNNNNCLVMCTQVGTKLLCVGMMWYKQRKVKFDWTKFVRWIEKNLSHQNRKCYFV